MYMFRSQFMFSLFSLNIASCFFCSSRRRHTRSDRDWSSDVCSSDLFEGVIGKRQDSRYEAGRRSASWLKVKPTRSADFVIGGYTRGKGSRAPLGALLVGYWDKVKLLYASHVGSGFDDKALLRMKSRLE